MKGDKIITPNENQRLNNAIALLSTDDDESKRHDDISSKLDTQTKHSEKLEKHNKEIKDHNKNILKIAKKDSLAHKAVQDNTSKMGEGKDSSGNLVSEPKPQSKLNEVFKEVTGDLSNVIKRVVPGAEYISKIGKILLRK